MINMINRFRLSTCKILISTTNNIHFNLATEQYLFQKAFLSQPTLFLWRNSANIVLGKHQNPWKQCRIEQMKNNGILLSRRKTGGGAVYQDLGNSCFSFLTPYDKNKQGDFKTINNKILIRTFKNLGVDIQIAGRNDLICQGKKISGSAYRLFLGGKDGQGKKALHHGTVLFSVDLQALQKYLNPNKKKLESKGVDSVISRVMNLNEIYPNLNHDIFCKELQQEFTKEYGTPQKEILSYQTLIKQNQIINDNYERLKSWDWLYGQCPTFKYTIDKKFDWGMTEITYNVLDGVIKQAKIYSDCLYPDFITLANQQILKNIKYESQGIKQFGKNLKEISSKQFQPYVNDLSQWMISQL